MIPHRGRDIFIVLIIFAFLLASCDQPAVDIIETSFFPDSYNQVVEMNNCGGKGASEENVTRAYSTTFEGAGSFKVGNKVVEGAISSKYGKSQAYSTSIKLQAPPGTNMKFVLRWSEEVHGGNVTVNGETRAYTIRIPISVSQESGEDLGGCSIPMSDSFEEKPDFDSPIPTVAKSSTCFSLTLGQIDDLRLSHDVPSALKKAEELAGHRQQDYDEGETVPRNVLIATNLFTDPTSFETIGVSPVMNKGGWGLFITQKEFVASYPGTYWCIEE